MCPPPGRDLQAERFVQATTLLSKRYYEDMYSMVVLPTVSLATPTETTNHDKSNNYQYYEEYTAKRNYSVHLQIGKKSNIL